ncbi:hypothetical protein [Luteolibacter sp. LG18]|uniref:DUF6979 family protein n=1 Tax=Luteolibacter sp. LG18 TaxID=2819286 RepID=UPI002B323B00|nr:hypothetical protein llg_17050 [Luteolibacter sp. LG18]
MASDSLYGRVAILAAKLCWEDRNPRAAWIEAAGEVCSNESSKTKHCPQGAFLGLCAKALFKNKKIQPDPKAKIGVNGEYAIQLVAKLQKDHSLEELSASDFWNLLGLRSRVDPSKKKAHNSQAHVVLALWRAGLIDGSPHAEASCK